MWSSRLELPRILNERGLTGIGVEVGVQTAWYGAQLRKQWDGLLYIGVDPYVVYPGSDVPQHDHEGYRAQAIAALDATGRPYELLRVPSVGGAWQLRQRYGMESLDFVYLDGDHEYSAVMADLEAWWPLVKPGGIIAGHDWVLDGWHADDAYRAFATREEAIASGPQGYTAGPFGVRQAVSEFFSEGPVDGTVRHNPVTAVTDPQQDGGWQSWLVVKP